MNVFLACAACYGQSDSAMVRGMNWGIVSLLVIVVCVLGGVAAFFVHVARRSAAVGQARTGAADFRPVHETERKGRMGQEGPHRGEPATCLQGNL